MNAFAIRYRLPVLLLSIGLVLLAIVPLTQLQINSDLESYMPDSMQSKQNNRKIEAYFSSAENLLIVVDAQSAHGADILEPENLRTLQQLSDELQQLPAVSRVHSVFQTTNILHRDGEMLIEPAIPFIPETAAGREQLRTSLHTNDLACGLVISDDFRYAMLMLEVKRDSTLPDADAVLLNQVQRTITETRHRHPAFDGAIYLTGQPYLRDDANRKISRDILILLPIGLVVMLLFLWISFRDFTSVLLPFSIVVFSIVVSMALIPTMGWELSLIGVLIPIMMIAIANNYGVHVIARYQELKLAPPAGETTDANHSLLSHTIRYLRKPVWLCGLTTIAGTMGLAAHLLIPARQMGVISSLGIAFALTLSLTYLPAAMSYFKIKTGRIHTKTTRPTHHLTPLLQHTARQLLKHPRIPIIVAAILFVLCLIGTTGLKVAPDSSSILPPNHEFNQAIRIADQQFGGSKLLNIMIGGDAREPALLEAIDSVSRHMERHPLVGHAASLATMIRKMHADTCSALPHSREAIAQYLELYGMSADVADYERFVDFSYSHTLLTIQYRSASLHEINSLLAELESTLQKHQLNYVIGGVSLVDKEISESVRTGQFSSLAVALLAILILLGIIFRSLQAGLIGSIPLVVAVVCTFGIMGWTGIKLDIVTALLSSISIGLGVDFTIHIFWRMKHELTQHQGDWNQAVINTLAGTGRGISINAFSVMIGFSVLLLSSFPFIQAFGLLIILSLLLCLASALLIIPVICILIKPRFLLTTNK
ncbi:MAG: hypothetical protein BGP01_15375 [Paludibacter sp. 47-17]|nr:MAG: hypothetical protein ABS72_04315 [Paludibacter sp. SCN 50-10]OJX90375.1 MAG: hypothetical protein BGP01_15375 [Paludibacter sp. 47-17]